MEKKLIKWTSLYNVLGSMIVKEGGSSVGIKRQLAMAKTSDSTLSNIWKDRTPNLATKIRVMKALFFQVGSLWLRDMGIRKADRGSNICLWNVVLEEATWDIMKRLHHQWTQFNVYHRRSTATCYQDRHVQATIVLVTLAEDQETTLTNYHSR